MNGIGRGLQRPGNSRQSSQQPLPGLTDADSYSPNVPSLSTTQSLVHLGAFDLAAAGSALQSLQLL